MIQICVVNVKKQTKIMITVNHMITSYICQRNSWQVVKIDLGTGLLSNSTKPSAEPLVIHGQLE